MVGATKNQEGEGGNKGRGWREGGTPSGNSCRKWGRPTGWSTVILALCVRRVIFEKNKTIKHVSLVSQQAAGSDQADEKEDKAEEKEAAE